MIKQPLHLIDNHTAARAEEEEVPCFSTLSPLEFFHCSISNLWRRSKFTIFFDMPKPLSSLPDLQSE